MSFIQDLAIAQGILKDGLGQLGTTVATTKAQKELQQLNEAAMDEQQKRAAQMQIANRLAQEFQKFGAPVAQQEAAKQHFGPAALPDVGTLAQEGIMFGDQEKLAKAQQLGAALRGPQRDEARTAYGQQLEIQRREHENRLEVAGMRGAGADRQNALKKVLTPGEEQIDKRVGAELMKWESEGGEEALQEQISKLEAASSKLKEGEISTGRLAGAALAVGLNKTLKALEDDVLSVSASNLKQILGTQFTEKDRIAFEERAFDPSLPTAVNKKRIDDKIKTLQGALKRRNAQLAKMRGWGTLSERAAKTAGLGPVQAPKVRIRNPKTGAVGLIDEDKLEAALAAGAERVD